MIQELIKKAIFNGGATVDANLQPITKKAGFMVSILGYEKTFSPENVEEIEKTISQYQTITEKRKNLYIGLWLDNGLLYVDLSKHINKKQNAIKFGINNMQLSVYDIAENNYIRLTKTKYIIYKYIASVDDFENVEEFDTLKEIENKYNIAKSCASHYVVQSLDNIKSLLNGQYIIFKDEELEETC